MSKDQAMSDEEIVAQNKDKAQIARAQELEDFRTILKTTEGRRFIWRLLSHCKVFGSIWSPSASIHYLAGKQDVGHFVLSEITEADENFLLKMMKEAKGANNV